MGYIFKPAKLLFSIKENPRITTQYYSRVVKLTHQQYPSNEKRGPHGPLNIYVVMILIFFEFGDNIQTSFCNIPDLTDDLCIQRQKHVHS